MPEDVTFKSLLDEYGRLSRICGAVIGRPEPLICFWKRGRLEREFQESWKVAAEQHERVLEAFRRGSKHEGQ